MILGVTNESGGATIIGIPEYRGSINAGYGGFGVAGGEFEVTAEPESIPGTFHVSPFPSDPLVSGTGTDSTSKTDLAKFTAPGLGRGLLVSATNSKNANAAIAGANAGTGSAVYASQSNAAATGGALVGKAGAKGRGAVLTGGAAAVTLSPSTATTHPSSGNAGDLFVDSTKRLWFCKGGTTWKQIA